MAVLETATLTYSFWPKTAQKYRETVHTESTRNEGTRAALFVKPHARVVWLCAFFLLGYVGTEVALGGWVVQFMLRVRNADPFDAGMTAVGFWLGITVGRAALGFVTPRFGVKLSTTVRPYDGSTATCLHVSAGTLWQCPLVVCLLGAIR